MAVRSPLEGLIAATFTPFLGDGSVDVEAIPPLVNFLEERPISGLYVLGSTGEGLSLTTEERRRVAHGFVQAAAGRLPVIVQVGCESLEAARLLAAHAQEVGADAISAVSPVYFKPDTVQCLVDSMAHVAAGAPKLPFYYYHIPGATGLRIDPLEFLKLASERIPTLRGIKFTSPNVFDFQACVEFARDRFELLWGVDEMLLSGLVAGARAAVGSTYNYAAPIYQRLLESFDEGNLVEAGRQQSRSQLLVRTFVPYGPRAAQKAIMAMIGRDCGPTRLPISPLDASSFDALEQALSTIGFFDWISDQEAESSS